MNPPAASELVSYGVAPDMRQPIRLPAGLTQVLPLDSPGSPRFIFAGAMTPLR